MDTWSFEVEREECSKLAEGHVWLLLAAWLLLLLLWWLFVLLSELAVLHNNQWERKLELCPSDILLISVKLIEKLQRATFVLKLETFLF